MTNDATWTSSDAAKATVSNKGLVTWKAEGTTNITASYQGAASTAVAITCAAASKSK